MIRLELDSLTTQSPTDEQAWPILDRFASEMEQGASAFFHLPEKSNWSQEWKNVSPQLTERVGSLDTFIHIGIGGSSLGAETLVRALSDSTAPQFHFLDSLDPDYTWNLLETVAPEKCLLYVVTKSGTTTETMAQFMFLFQWLETRLGTEAAKKRLVFCTDAEKGDLRKLANTWQIPSFSIPSRLGGRYSVLSAVGLFPAVVAGVDPTKLIKGAYDLRKQIITEIAQGKVPQVAGLAFKLANLYRERGRNITVLMPYSQRLKPFSAWFTQLWAESLGKDGLGITPVPSVGPTDQHSILQLLRDGPQDKVVGFIEVAGFNKLLELKWKGPRLDSIEGLTGVTMNQIVDAEYNATRQVLSNAKKPHFSVILPRLDEESVGALFYFFETLTALTGYVLGVNPFDQPGVEEGKLLTAERLQACKKSQLS